MSETSFDLINLYNSISKVKVPAIKQDLAQSKVYLFFSFDLSESTTFKIEHPTLWANVFANFYTKLLEILGVENYRGQSSIIDDSNCVRKLWKLIGDEVLIYIPIYRINDLYPQILSIYNSLENMMDKIAEVSSNSCTTLNTDTFTCLSHCQNIKQVILSSLGIKATAWIAECFTVNHGNVPNIIYEVQTPESIGNHVDFLGRDIDEGFRIAKYAAKNKLILSPLLAWLIWKWAKGKADEEKIVDANFRITAFLHMKGVWKNRKVPIVMFHQNFDQFCDILEYDELDLITYSNIKDVSFDRFVSDSRFKIRRIDFILDNVHRKDDAYSLFTKLTETTSANISATFSTIKELHIACIAFTDDSKVLIHKDPDRGLEFGCAKYKYWFEENSWKEACENGYKTKYGISIVTDPLPVPVATYHFDKNQYGNLTHIFGLIVLGSFNQTENKHLNISEWMILSKNEILEKIQIEKTVENFEQNLRRAYALHDLLNTERNLNDAT